MAAIVTFVESFLSLLTLMGWLLVIFTLVCWLFVKKPNWSKRWIGFVQDNAMRMAFIVAIVAFCGSMFFSEVAQYGPCLLCWYQRINIFPLFMLLGIGLWFSDEHAYRYVFPLSLIGGVIAAYHYWVQHLPSAVPCAVVGASCTTRYLYSYGFLTISGMAFSACLFIFVLMIMQWKKVKQ